MTELLTVFLRDIVPLCVHCVHIANAQARILTQEYLSHVY